MDPPKRVPPKRKRDAEEVREEERRLRPHPYGIRPEGNMFLEAVSNCRNAGLGTLQPISDTLVGEILGYLPAESLCIASTASKSLYAFSHADDLWKPLTLFSLRKDGKYFYDANGWKQTYINTKWKFLGKKGSPPRHSPIRVTNFFSDTLYHPHHDASMRIPPAWTRVNNVDRVSAKTLTKRAFVDTYETPGVPVVIQDLVSEWPSFRKWDWQYLLQFSDAEFQCEAAKLTLEEFKTYSDNQLDDRPLYLFDSKFCDTVPQFKEDYEVPQYFTDDLFKVLGSARPDYRWLIMGPTRSGSSFHKDPNSTDAWNACIRGLKKWVFFPPSVVPPGVICSADGTDVTSPISLVEWFSSYYDRCDEVKVRPLEVIVKPGELMYIPAGWWHLCLNLTPTVCITQNYVSRAGLPRVLSFLRDSPQCISGVCQEDRPSFYERFRSKLQEQLPAVLAEAEQKEKSDTESQTPWAKAMEDSTQDGFTFDW